MLTGHTGMKFLVLFLKSVNAEVKKSFKITYISRAENGSSASTKLDDYQQFSVNSFEERKFSFPSQKQWLLQTFAVQKTVSGYYHHWPDCRCVAHDCVLHWQEQMCFFL